MADVNHLSNFFIMRASVIFLLLCLPFVATSQIKFEKGHIITNDGSKIECYIKNADKLLTPAFFEYKINLSDTEVHLANVANTKEVFIGDSYHFVKYEVKIDVSRQKSISVTREPELEKKTLFLQRIVDSDNALYRYTVGDMNYFFYKKKNDIEPTLLVYKKYIAQGKTTYNEHYKQQLFTEFSCVSIDLTTIENLAYKEQSLIKFFIDYNNCTGAVVNTMDYPNKGFFNIKIAPRVNFNKINAEYRYMPRLGYDAEFDNKISFSAGVEFEYVLGFNKNKWAFFIEPNYHSFKGETNYINSGVQTDKTSEITYSSMEVPLGVRYYMHLNETSKCFVNLGYALDLQLDMALSFEGTSANITDGVSGPSFIIGAGYNFNNKFDAEIRYTTPRNLTFNYDMQHVKYNNLSLILRYNLL